MSSSLAAILVAAAPLSVALPALRFDAEERATGTRLVGLLLGSAGGGGGPPGCRPTGGCRRGWPPS